LKFNGFALANQGGKSSSKGKRSHPITDQHKETAAISSINVIISKSIMGGGHSC